MVLLIDNYDSFTYNLVDYFARSGTDCKVVRNDSLTIEEIKGLDFEAIVLSPGPGRPAGAGVTLEVIAHFYQTKPILGICLGHQALGEYFGANLEKAGYPQHGKISLAHHTGHWLFEGVPNTFEVMRYHSLILKNMPGTLEITSTTEAGEVMSISHNKWPLEGIQFHPESVLTQHGLRIVQNWVSHI